jgi:hypothetical protein
MTTRSSSRVLLAVTVAALVAGPKTANAWPFPANITREQAADPMLWPNDPDYAESYQHWSFIPMRNQMLANFRTEELAIGAGNNTDRAWGLTLGDPHVLISVLDSGIKWDNDGVQFQAAINLGETPRPLGIGGIELPLYDADGNGRIDVRDWANDPRIPCGIALPHPMRACRDAMGMPNDPNRNGVFDAGDLIRVFSNGVDDDRNGYVDDISGWDFFKDDNDPYDDTRYGHGTGEANDSTATANDGIGGVGGCPECQFVPLRVGDSFVTDVNDFAKAVIYATDLDYGASRRVRVIQEALGTLNNSIFAMDAIDYAYNHGLLVVASAADENSRHHNMPGTNNHVLYVHAIRGNRDLSHATSFLAFNNCTNYGGQLMLSVAGDSCSSEAVGNSSGIAGLLYSYARQRNLDPTLSAEEARQLFIQNVDDVNIPESQPTHPMFNRQLYPSQPGWDQRFGYGRPNARAILEAVRDGRIPPEVDISSPRWFAMVYPDRTPMLQIEGRIAARRATNFDYTVEYATGIEPTDADYRTAMRGSNVNAAINGTLGTIDVSRLVIDNPGERENRYTLTVRVRATAHYPAAIGDVTGEFRKVFYVHHDPTLMQGFPIDLRSSGESAPKIADLNGDGRGEVIIATADGVVHAFRADGTELPGWPARLNPMRGFDGVQMVGGRVVDYRGGVGYQPGTPGRIDPANLREFVLAAPAIANIDDEPQLEVVVASYSGTVYVFNHDGTPYGHGFPRQLPNVPSEETAENRILDRGIAGAAVLADLDRNGRVEIIFGGFDGNLYAIDTLTAANHPGFPVNIHYTLEPGSEYNRVFGPVGVGRLDNDELPDLVVVTNERIVNSDRNQSPIFVVHGDGMRHAGGPFHSGWPIPVNSRNLLPVVGSGIMNAPALADVDGDRRDELAVVGNANTEIYVVRAEQTMVRPRMPDTVSRLMLMDNISFGVRSDSPMRSSPFVPAFSLPTFADMQNGGRLAFLVSGANAGLIAAASGGIAAPFSHLLAAWDAQEGTPLSGFPKLLEDYTLLANPVVADVSGDAYPEALLGTAGYYLHAVNSCGVEAPNFPKFTGQWVGLAPAVGDLDGDGFLEVVVPTRNGWLYAWRTPGRVTGNVQWPSYRHDNSNTGNWGTALPFGVKRVDGAPSIVCPPRDSGVVTDAEEPDATADAATVPMDSTRDGGNAMDVVDAGPMQLTGSGCACKITANPQSKHNRAPLLLWAVASVTALSVTRKRRALRSHSSR